MSETNARPAGPGRRRVAIIGAGVGIEHLVGYVLNPRHFDVTTICDLDRRRAESLVAMVPTARSTSDVDAVLADPTIEVVSVCTPPYTHLDLALLALAAGKHVVVEKPVAASPAQVDQLAAAARTAGRLAVPVFQYRFAKGPRILRRLVAEGLAGPPVAASLTVHWNRDASYFAVPWRGSAATELGGAVLSHAIHAHDLVTHLMAPAVRVHAEVGTLVHDIEVEDTAAVVLRLAGGALVSSSVTLGAAGGDLSRYRLVYADLTVESGAAPYAPGEDHWTFVARDPARQPAVDAVVAADRPERNGFAGLFHQLGEALAGRAEPPVSLADAHAALSLGAATYHSARTGTAVDLPLPPDHPAYDRTP